MPIQSTLNCTTQQGYDHNVSIALLHVPIKLGHQRVHLFYKGITEVHVPILSSVERRSNTVILYL